jgi:hypothetical protein
MIPDPKSFRSQPQISSLSPHFLISSKSPLLITLQKFDPFIGLPNKLLFTAKTGKSKRAVGLRAFALSKKATGFVPEQNIAIKSLNANQLKKMNKSYVCFLGEISVSQIIKKNALTKP